MIREKKSNDLGQEGLAQNHKYSESGERYDSTVYAPIQHSDWQTEHCAGY